MRQPITSNRVYGESRDGRGFPAISLRFPLCQRSVASPLVPHRDAGPLFDKVSGGASAFLLQILCAVGRMIDLAKRADPAVQPAE